MSRLLILANDYKTIANFRMELLDRLISEGHEVFLSLPSDERNSVFEEMGCHVLPTPISRHGTNPLAEWKLLRAYRRMMQQLRPDCVLTFTIKPNIYGSFAAGGLKIPVINNVTGLGSAMQSNNPLRKLMLWLQKRAYRSSSCVFFQNEGNLSYFRQCGIVGEQARLLPGSGVNLSLHSFCEYPTEQNGIDLAIVSRLRQDKGFDEFFAMVDALLTDEPTVRFHIIGWIEEERYREALSRYCNEPRVIYHGEVTQSEVHELLRHCHCLCHPSYHEGMANVVMEAAAAGRPALVSDIPGCRELVEPGVTGMTFAARDASALTEAVRAFLGMSEEQHKRMGRLAHEKMAREFDREIVIQKYLLQINAAVSGNAAERDDAYVSL